MTLKPNQGTPNTVNAFRVGKINLLLASILTGWVFLFLVFECNPLSICVGEARAQGFAAQRMACGNNLSAIGKAMVMYRTVYDDALPPTPYCLVEEGLIPCDAFACPDASGGMKEALSNRKSSSKKEMHALVNGESDYFLIFRRLVRGVKIPGAAVNLYELPANHNQVGVNIMDFNGGVQWLKTDASAWRRRIQRSNDLLDECREEAES